MQIDYVHGYDGYYAPWMEETPLLPLRPKSQKTTPNPSGVTTPKIPKASQQALVQPPVPAPNPNILRSGLFSLTVCGLLICLGGASFFALSQFVPARYLFPAPPIAVGSYVFVSTVFREVIYRKDPLLWTDIFWEIVRGTGSIMVIWLAFVVPTVLFVALFMSYT